MERVSRGKRLLGWSDEHPIRASLMGLIAPNLVLPIARTIYIALHSLIPFTYPIYAGETSEDATNREIHKANLRMAGAYEVLRGVDPPAQ